MTTYADDIESMVAEVERLSGKRTASRNRKYLAERLAELRKNVPITVSMSKPAQLAIERMIDGELKAGRLKKRNASEMHRLALAEYARNHGYSGAEIIHGD